MEAEKIKTLLELLENADKGGEKEFENLEAFLNAEGLSYEDAVKYATASVEKKPETPVEERRQTKNKAFDDKKTKGEIPMADIAKANGVDLEEAGKNGELKTGALQKYLSDRFVLGRAQDEGTDEYTDRMRNVFESLGLNYNNPEDRARYERSIALAIENDDREGLADEFRNSVTGRVGSVIFPRLTEDGIKAILEGGDVDNAIKDILLDVGEDVLMLFPNPVTAPLKALAGLNGVQRAYKTFKKGKAILDGRTNANKALRGFGTLAGIGADAAAVPLVTEVADAVAYDDPENPRSEFSGEDVALGAAVNAITPALLARQGRRSAGRLAGDELGKIDKAVGDIKKVLPNTGAKGNVGAFVTNKLGRTETARQIPILEEIVVNKKQEDEFRQKRSEALREKKARWAKGFSIPMPGDRDYEEYTKWKDDNLKKVLGFEKFL